MEQVLINRSTLTGIGNAIREKESSNDLVPVNDMAERIKAIASSGGRKTTTGTITFATESARQTITHNLGSIPTLFFMVVKDKNLNFTFNTENQAQAGIYGFIWSKYDNLLNMFSGSIATNTDYGRSIEWRNDNKTQLKWYENGYGASPMATETTILATYRNSTYKYLANVEYEWIAIE